MVLNLKSISAGPDYVVTVRNHKDGVMGFLEGDHLEWGRWLNKGSSCTELNITTSYGHNATIYLEDDKNYNIVVSGNIDGRRSKCSVKGSVGFSATITGDGKLRLRCEEGETWGDGSEVLEFNIPPFRN